VAFSGSTDFVPEVNRWLQIVVMEDPVRSSRAINVYVRHNLLQFKFKLTAVMILDFVGCWFIEKVCKRLFADLEPRALITRGRERREQRRLEEAEKSA
jgi:manganese-transporting P-type ATPase